MMAKSGVLKLNDRAIGTVLVRFDSFPSDGDWLDAAGNIVDEEDGVAQMLQPRSAGDNLGIGSFWFPPAFTVQIRDWVSRVPPEEPPEEGSILDTGVTSSGYHTPDRYFLRTICDRDSIRIVWRTQEQAHRRRGAF